MASPGPGIFALVASSLKNRFLSTFFLGFGLSSGDVVYIVLAIFGMAKIASLWSDFFFYVQLFGGFYLLFLGAVSIFQKPHVLESEAERKAKKEKDLFKQWITGVLISLSNPKTILFYLGFLPAFIDLNALGATDAALVIVVLFSACILTCLVYILAIGGLRKVLKSQSSIRIFNVISGGLMVVVGLYLLFRAFNWI